jgi:hypothetical protein
MTAYKIGSKGDEVRKIQERLKAFGYYSRSIDGAFGRETEAGVKAFQSAKKITVDGIVGPETWKALFEEIHEPSILRESLDYKSLALAGCFETGRIFPECFAGLAGDFDEQGMSLGVLQWNLGQDTLQPLLKDMIEEHPGIMREIFQGYYLMLTEALNSNKNNLMAFARSIQHPVQHFLYEPWKGMFKALGRTEEFQRIQVKYAGALFKSAVRLCSEYGLWSERAVALMFDIKVQNGNISKVVKTRILSDFEALSKDLARGELEVQKMRVVANRRAEAANPKWVEDVRIRKLCCANGSGIVYGISYDLKEQFGVRLKPHELDMLARAKSGTRSKKTIHSSRC